MIKLFVYFFLTLSFQYCFCQGEIKEKIEYKYASDYYVDTLGTKHEGDIFVKTNNIVFYATDRDKKENIKLRTIDTLVLNTKRFLIIKKIKLKAELGITSDNFKNLLVEELIAGKINLYKTNAITGLQTGTTNPPRQASYGEEYYIVQTEHSEFAQVKTGNKKFRKLMTSLMEDNTEALDEININKKNYSNLIEIIKLYNSKYK